MDHVISADESEMIEVKIKMMDWASEIMDLFHYGNKEAIHQAIQGLWTRYNREFDGTILLYQLYQLKTPEEHWTFTSPAAMIGAAICLFAIGFCLWKCCCQTTTTPPLQPSAPPMPTPVILPQPASAPLTMPNPVQRTDKQPINWIANSNAIPINITIT
jgi:hypothetical protein